MLIALLRAWRSKAGKHGRPFCLVDFDGVKVLIEENHEHGIQVLTDIFVTKVLSELAAQKDIPTLDLQLTRTLIWPTASLHATLHGTP